jgi:hypothetical protein
VPFDLFGILLEDKHVEMVASDDFAQSFGKNVRQFLRFATRGKCLREKKQRFLVLSINAQHEVWFRAHTFRVPGNPRDSAKKYSSTTEMTHVAERSHFLPRPEQGRKPSTAQLGANSSSLSSARIGVA